MGEITDSDDYRVWMNEEMLDSVTNYECYRYFFSCANNKTMLDFSKCLQRQFGENGIYKDSTLYTFVDNHDVNRIVNMIKSKKNLRNLYTLLYTIPGTPSIYYGSEWAIEGKKEHRSDAALRPAIDTENPDIIDAELMEHLKKLAEIRQSSPALKSGTYKEICAEKDYFIFARISENDTKLIFINISGKAQTLSADFEGKRYEFIIPAYSSKIADK